MTREEFYRRFVVFLRSIQDGIDLPVPEPATHLWIEGYINSVQMLEVLVFLEESTGRDIDLGPASAGTFDTMETIYRTYVAAARPVG